VNRISELWSLAIPNHLLREVVKLFAIVAWAEQRKKRFVAQPQSGEMFIARRARNDWQLRRSAMFSTGRPEWAYKYQKRPLL
jgi:hypothetical protein